MSQLSVSAIDLGSTKQLLTIFRVYVDVYLNTGVTFVSIDRGCLLSFPLPKT